MTKVLRNYNHVSWVALHLLISHELPIVTVVSERQSVISQCPPQKPPNKELSHQPQDMSMDMHKDILGNATLNRQNRFNVKDAGLVSCLWHNFCTFAQI